MLASPPWELERRLNCSSFAPADGYNAPMKTVGFFLSLVNHMSKEDEGHHAGLLRALESPASLASGHADIL